MTGRCTDGLSGVKIVDLWARAVIAAARTYGDDPVAAMTARGGRRRRCLAAAASALGRVGVSPASVAGRIFGLGGSSVTARRAKASAEFLAAEASAIAAIRGVLPTAAKAPIVTVEDPPSLRPAPEPDETRLEPGSFDVERAAEREAQGGAVLAVARTLSAARVRREVLVCLEEDPCSGPELMQLVGVGEGQIRAALQALADEGRVVGTPLTAEGWAARTWRIA